MTDWMEIVAERAAKAWKFLCTRALKAWDWLMDCEKECCRKGKSEDATGKVINEEGEE